MSEVTKRIWAVCLYDMVAVSGFITLAWYFNHWWIALFGLLFIGGYKYDERDCDPNKEVDVDEGDYKEAE